MNSFRLSGVSDRFWNKNQFIEFLFIHQSQPIVLEMDPEAVCMHKLGVYDLLESLNFQDVTIITANPFENHHKYQLKYLPNQWFSKIQSIDQNLHAWNKRKIFYALFGRPTAGRLGIAAYLSRYHRNITHLHFSAKTQPDDLKQFELDKLLSYRVQSIEDVGFLIDQLPLLLSSPDRYTAFNGYDYQDSLTDFYRDILIDIVVESHVAGKTFYPTEKTLRPMWLKKPFVIFSSKNYLLYLRQMGFRTFSDFWSEDYDGFEGPERLSMILDLLDDLGRRSHTQLEKMYWDMTYSLDHNFELLKNQSYNTKLTYMD